MTNLIMTMSLIMGVLITALFSTSGSFEIGAISIGISRLRDYIPIVFVISMSVFWIMCMICILFYILRNYEPRRKYMNITENMKRIFDFYSSILIVVLLICLPYILIFIY